MEASNYLVAFLANADDVFNEATSGRPSDLLLFIRDFLAEFSPKRINFIFSPFDIKVHVVMKMLKDLFASLSKSIKIVSVKSSNQSDIFVADLGDKDIRDGHYNNSMATIVLSNTEEVIAYVVKVSSFTK